MIGQQDRSEHYGLILLDTHTHTHMQLGATKAPRNLLDSLLEQGASIRSLKEKIRIACKSTNWLGGGRENKCSKVALNFHH